jgi:hypothetical protein
MSVSESWPAGLETKASIPWDCHLLVYASMNSFLKGAAAKI